MNRVGSMLTLFIGPTAVASFAEATSSPTRTPSPGTSWACSRRASTSRRRSSRRCSCRWRTPTPTSTGSARRRGGSSDAWTADGGPRAVLRPATPATAPWPSSSPVRSPAGSSSGGWSTNGSGRGPWGVLACTLLGVIGGFVQLIRVLRRLTGWNVTPDAWTGCSAPLGAGPRPGGVGVGVVGWPGPGGVLLGGAVVGLSLRLSSIGLRMLRGSVRPRLAIGILFVKLLALLGTRRGLPSRLVRAWSGSDRLRARGELPAGGRGVGGAAGEGKRLMEHHPFTWFGSTGLPESAVTAVCRRRSADRVRAAASDGKLAATESRPHARRRRHRAQRRARSSSS